MPPSQVVSLPPLNGVVPPSGKVMVSAPLSVVKTTMVLLVWPMSSIFLSTRPMLSSICFMPASLTPQSLPPGSPTMAMYLSDNTVVMCMRAGLYQTKNGLLVSSRIVAVEEVDDLGRDFLVHGLRPLQGQRALVLARLILRRAVGGFAPEHRARRRQAGRGLGVHGAGDFRQARDRRVLARRSDGLLRRGLVDVGEAHPLHRVEVIEIAPEFLEAVRGRQRVGVVAQMVLAELAGVVAEIEQELGERRRAGPQIGRAAGELRRDHAGAQRMHAGEEGIAPRRAALLGVVVGELRAFLPDAVDVGRFADHQAAMIDARLHPADVIAHDEEDVGLALRLCGRLLRRTCRSNERPEQTDP